MDEERHVRMRESIYDGLSAEALAGTGLAYLVLCCMNLHEN
jgi:hypothetical protein